MSAPACVRVGMDLVSVDDVAASVAHFGDRYVTRIYTSHEIATCRERVAGRAGGDALAVESLAARFAAKEAVMKVLRPADVQVDWRSIEVHRMTGGWCEIRLSGQAEAMAAEAGIDGFAVSLSHEAAVAAAVVVGWSTREDRGDG